MSTTRRSFLTAGAAAGALGFPMIARAQSPTPWKMTSAYAKGAPFYMEGPGSATDLAKRIREMSSGRLNIQVFGAGELIPAFERATGNQVTVSWRLAGGSSSGRNC